MARPKAKAPALRYHISGQSVVTIDGRDFYLGKHDSSESLARYAVLIGVYQSGGLVLPEDFDQETLNASVARMMGGLGVPSTHQADEPILVRHLTAAYVEFAKKRYANSKAELPRVVGMCGELDAADGDELAVEYGPRALKRQRQRWVDSGKSRLYCNRLTNLVIRMYKWASSEELVGESAWNWLKSLEPLKVGHTDAPESEPIRPVAIADVV